MREQGAEQVLGDKIVWEGRSAPKPLKIRQNAVRRGKEEKGKQ